MWLHDKVVRLGIRRQPGYLYFVQWNGVYRTPMKNHCRPAEQGQITRVKAIYFEREPGYFYYVDRDGDIARYRLTKAQPAPLPWWKEGAPL